MEPVEEVDVHGVQAGIRAPATEGAVLMLAGAMEIEGLSVDQEVGSGDPHLPDAEGKIVEILPETDPGGIEVGRARPGLPEMGRRYLQSTFRAAAGGYRAPIRIQNLQGGPSLTGGFDPPGDLAGEGGNQGDILNAAFRRGIEADRPLNARVVEEVKGGQVDALDQLTLFASLHGGDAGVVRSKEGSASLGADGQGAMADAVIHLHQQLRGIPGGEQIRQLDFEGQESAAMGADLPAVQEYPGGVGDRVKAQEDPLALPDPWQGDPGFIPGEARVIAEGRIRHLVIVGGRDGDGLPGSILLQAEGPDSREIQEGAGGIGLGIKHGEGLLFIFGESACRDGRRSFRG